MIKSCELVGTKLQCIPRGGVAMELLPEIESLCDSLFWDRADVEKRLASLRKLQTAVTCEGARPSSPSSRRRHESSNGAHPSFSLLDSVRGGAQAARRRRPVA